MINDEQVEIVKHQLLGDFFRGDIHTAWLLLLLLLLHSLYIFIFNFNLKNSKS